MSEFRFIDLYSSSHLTKFVFTVVILEINVNQMPYAPIDIIAVVILELGDTIFLKIPKAL